MHQGRFVPGGNMTQQGDPWGSSEYPQQGYRQNPPGQPWQGPQYDPWADSQQQPPPPATPWGYQDRHNGGRAVPPQFQTGPPQSRQEPYYQQPGPQFTQQPQRLPSWSPQQYQAPQWQQPYAPPQNAPQRPRPRKSRKGLTFLGCGGLGALFVLITILASSHGGGNTSNTPTGSASVAASTPAAAGKPSFPPKTLADFQAFAATGDASQVHQVASSSEGLPSCPQPNFYVTVSLSLTGQALAADLSAFYVQQGLLNNQCGAAVFAFYSMSDYQAHKDSGFTAGRVILDNNGGSSPQFNLEVDAGAAVNTQADFEFNY